MSQQPIRQARRQPKNLPSPSTIPQCTQCTQACPYCLRGQKRRAPRSIATKCEEILTKMREEDNIGIRELLEYIKLERRTPSGRKIFAATKQFVLEGIFPLLDNTDDDTSDAPLLGDDDWQLIMNNGGWQFTEKIIRQEVIDVSQLPQISGSLKNKILEEEQISTDTILPINEIYKSAPYTTQLIESACQPILKRDKRVKFEKAPIAFIMTSLCHIQQPYKCDTISGLLALYLNAMGLRVSALTVLHRLGISSGYHKVRDIQHIQVKKTQLQIKQLQSEPTINITFDNLDMAEGVNEVRLGDQGIHHKATTALINLGIEMPPQGLTQDMLDTSIPLDILQLLNVAELAEDKAEKVCFIFLSGQVGDTSCFSGQVGDTSCFSGQVGDTSCFSG